jgi:hypothetical protein
MKNFQEITYVGIKGHCLDILTLKYRWFGAVWLQTIQRRIIMNYWFADTEQELLIKLEAYEKAIRDDSAVENVYETIRSDQTKKDWEHHTLKPIGRRNRVPWKRMRTGWYVLRLQSTFPCYAAAVHVKAFFVWMAQSTVCENQQDFDKFTKKISLYHNISNQ